MFPDFIQCLIRQIAVYSIIAIYFQQLIKQVFSQYFPLLSPNHGDSLPLTVYPRNKNLRLI